MQEETERAKLQLLKAKPEDANQIKTLTLKSGDWCDQKTIELTFKIWALELLSFKSNPFKTEQGNLGLKKKKGSPSLYRGR